MKLFTHIPKALVMILAIPLTGIANDKREIKQSANMLLLKLTNQTVQGNGWYMYVSENGILKGKEGSYGDQGQWHIADNGEFCRTWQSWGQGVESCFTVTFSQDTKLTFKRVSGPTATFKGKLLSGNPHGL